jgi:hypothetical protein
MTGTTGDIASTGSSRVAKIFVYEHITGGGCLDAPPKPPEALLMARAPMDLEDIGTCSRSGCATGSLRTAPRQLTAVRSRDRRARVDVIRLERRDVGSSTRTGGS